MKYLLCLQKIGTCHWYKWVVDFLLNINHETDSTLSLGLASLSIIGPWSRFPIHLWSLVPLPIFGDIVIAFDFRYVRFSKRDVSYENIIALSPLHEVVPPGTHLTTGSTEATRIKCLAQGHLILMPGFEPSTLASRIRHPNHMNNVPL